MEILSTVLLLSSPLTVTRQHYSITALLHKKSRGILGTLLNAVVQTATVSGSELLYDVK